MPRSFSRRSVLKSSAGAAATLTAGSAMFRAGAVAAQDATPAASTIGEIVIPDAVAELPTDDVTFRWIDSGGLTVPFYDAVFEAYEAARPNITVEYEAYEWPKINQLIPISVQNGNAPDVMVKPQDIPESQMVSEGWVAPLDDIIPNFDEWKARFPLGTFLEGVHEFDGKTYACPLSSTKRYATMTFYNTRYMQEAGFDPEEERLTWDTFREAARKITEQGQGQYYGLIMEGKNGGNLDTVVRNLGRQAGASGGASLGFDDIDWRTGEFQYMSDEYLGAVELLLAIQADGSLFPGSIALSAAETRGRFPQGVAGMILQGPWNIPQWQADHPEFEFGLVSQPIPNDGQETPLTYTESGSNSVWVYAESPYKAIAGDLFSYIGSVNGQTALMTNTGGNLRALLPEAVDAAMESVQMDAYALTALALYDEQMRSGPIVTVRNPEAAQIVFERKPVTPNFGDVLTGLMIGELTDVKSAMQDLQDRTEAELERAIAAAQEKGAEVSRDDFVFANWDPTSDYSQADYEEVQG